MKSPSYVYLATKLYREAIDSYCLNGQVKINLDELDDLKKIFTANILKDSYLMTMTLSIHTALIIWE